MDLDIRYRTGVIWQDRQHGDWINLLSRLKGENGQLPDKGLFEESVSFLVMYVNFHFRLEEEYMRVYKYPEIRFHSEEHRIYTLRLKDFREKNREYSMAGLEKIIQGMTEWIYSHITENDLKLGNFILQQVR